MIIMEEKKSMAKELEDMDDKIANLEKVKASLLSRSPADYGTVDGAVRPAVKKPAVKKPAVKKVPEVNEPYVKSPAVRKPAVRRMPEIEQEPTQMPTRPQVLKQYPTRPQEPTQMPSRLQRPETDEDYLNFEAQAGFMPDTSDEIMLRQNADYMRDADLQCEIEDLNRQIDYLISKGEELKARRLANMQTSEQRQRPEHESEPDSVVDDFRIPVAETSRPRPEPELEPETVSKNIEPVKEVQPVKDTLSARDRLSEIQQVKLGLELLRNEDLAEDVRTEKLAKLQKRMIRAMDGFSPTASADVVHGHKIGHATVCMTPEGLVDPSAHRPEPRSDAYRFLRPTPLKPQVPDASRQLSPSFISYMLNTVVIESIVKAVKIPVGLIRRFIAVRDAMIPKARSPEGMDMYMEKDVSEIDRHQFSSEDIKAVVIAGDDAMGLVDARLKDKPVDSEGQDASNDIGSVMSGKFSRQMEMSKRFISPEQIENINDSYKAVADRRAKDLDEEDREYD